MFSMFIFVGLGLLYGTEVSCQDYLYNDGDGRSDDTVLRYSYAENDEKGPLHWGKKRLVMDEYNESMFIPYLADRLQTTNYCVTRWFSPALIKSDAASAPEVMIDDRDSDGSDEAVENAKDGLPPTLTIVVTQPHIQLLEWELGHPTDTYHGIEVRATNLGLFQVLDKLDPIRSGDKNTAYDFKYLSVFYCDLGKASPSRTMHQIDGVRYPLELEFVFFKRVFKGLGIDSNIPSEEDEEEGLKLSGKSNAGVIVTVQGEIDEEDNKYLQPLIEAAKKFRGKDFTDYSIDTTNVVPIESPWSATWLLPDSSAYYYYDEGSFPVPPCWRVSRYYIMKERIKISQRQLDVLTGIETDREPRTDFKMPCTFSLLQHEVLPTDVTQSFLEYDLQGDDHKPRDEEEVKTLSARKKKSETFRMRLAGQAVVEKDGSEKLRGNFLMSIISVGLIFSS